MNDDITDKGTLKKIGMISSNPEELAVLVSRDLEMQRDTVTVFVANGGNVYTQPSALGPLIAPEEIIGVYSASVDTSDIADDLRSTFVPRLAAIGILLF